MDYQIDLDPTHRVLRLTVTAPVLTDELFANMYRSVSLVASQGGPHAVIFDVSGVTRAMLSHAVLDFAFRPPAVPGPRSHVAVAKEPAMYGLARMLQMLRDFPGGPELHVVHSLKEAYETVGVRPEDFTERVFPTDRAA